MKIVVEGPSDLERGQYNQIGSLVITMKRFSNKLLLTSIGSKKLPFKSQNKCFCETKIIVFFLQSLAAPCLWMWTRWLRPWQMSHGLTPKGPTRSSHLWHHLVAMRAATHRTPTASWDVSPVVPTTLSQWRHTVTVGGAPTAPIRVSPPVSRDDVSQQENLMSGPLLLH